MYEFIEKKIALIHGVREQLARETFATADFWAHCTSCSQYDEEEELMA